jgi:hypothetical protein
MKMNANREEKTMNDEERAELRAEIKRLNEGWRGAARPNKSITLLMLTGKNQNERTDELIKTKPVELPAFMRARP